MSTNHTTGLNQQQTLKQLKQQLKHAELEKEHAKQLQQEIEQHDERTLFAQAMTGVQPLAKSNDAIIEQPKKRKVDAQTLARRAAAEGDIQTDDTLLSDTKAVLNPVSNRESLSYKIRTLQDKVFDDLKAGRLPWFEAVDLHGCSIEQARTAVLQIIQMAKNENQTVLKIVHGKGLDAVLKTHVNGWLRQHPDVLAFVSAPNNQGGSGAVLVLIKRASRQKNV